MIPNPSQEPPASSKAQNEDLKDMDVLFTFKIKIEGKNSGLGISKTSDHIQIKMSCQAPVRKLQQSQEPKIRNGRPWRFFAPSKSI